MSAARYTACRTFAGFVLAVLLAACSDVPATDGSIDSSEQSPLAPYYYTAWGSADDQAEQARRAEVVIDEGIAKCMGRAGFEYKLAASNNAIDDASDVAGDRTSVDYLSTYGYGIATAQWESPPVAETPTVEELNEEYLSTLTDVGRQEFSDALYGIQTEVSEDTYAPLGGCINEVMDELYGHDVMAPDEWGYLREAMSAVTVSAESSPVAEQVLADWSNCMADLGYEGFASPDGLKTSLRTLLEAQVTPDETGLMVTDSDGLAALREREIILAVADFDCQSTVDFIHRMDEVLWAYEEDFVEAYRPDLESWALDEAERRRLDH